MTGHPRADRAAGFGKGALRVAEEAAQLLSAAQQNLGTWYQREHGQR